MSGQAAYLTMNLVLVGCLGAIFGLALIRRSAPRTTAGAFVLSGAVVIVASVLRAGKHAEPVTDFLTFRAPGQGFEDFLFLDFPLVLGYAFVLGAVIAVPWLRRD